MSSQDPVISVFSVSWKSYAFLEALVQNLRAFAASPDALEFIIADNTNGADREIYRLEAARCTVVPVDSTGLTMSMAHAAGLNALMPHATAPYTLVIDPDIAVLQRGWDAVLIDLMTTRDLAAIGAPYPSWKIGKYHDFPSPPFAFWKTETLRALSPNWTPYARSTGGRFGDFLLRQLFWLPKLIDRHMLRLPARAFRTAAWLEQRVRVVSKDTGWEVADSARKQELTALVLDAPVAPPAIWLAQDDPLSGI